VAIQLFNDCCGEDKLANFCTWREVLDYLDQGMKCMLLSKHIVSLFPSFVTNGCMDDKEHLLQNVKKERTVA